MDEETAAALMGIFLILKKKQQTMKKKRQWTRQWLARRNSENLYYRLVNELRLEDHETMPRWIRLNKNQFYELLSLVTPLIQKQDTRLRKSVQKQDTPMRKSVTAAERLTLTLRHLATGETHRSLSCQFRISHNLISSIIPEVCQAIYQVLKPDYIKLPTTEDEWHQVANSFYAQWNFPNCLGALDGKRVLLSKPPHSGSQYYDYKGHFSVILMAMVDADYKFLYVDVGACARASDGGVWDRCTLKRAIEDNVLNIPEPQNLPFSNRKCPYVIVGDDAFPLSTYLMKPYPGRDQTAERRIYNYRLSRARRVSENAFGILAARFQIFKAPINTSPDNVKNIVFATVALHNYLRATSKDTYTPVGFVDREDTDSGRLHEGRWHHHPHDGLQRLNAVPRFHGNNVKDIREQFKAYFINEGEVPWQDRVALMH